MLTISPVARSRGQARGPPSRPPLAHVSVRVDEATTLDEFAVLWDHQADPSRRRRRPGSSERFGRLAQIARQVQELMQGLAQLLGRRAQWRGYRIAANSLLQERSRGRHQLYRL